MCDFPDTTEDFTGFVPLEFISQYKHNEVGPTVDKEVYNPPITINELHWALKTTLGLTLRGGGRGHLCSSILQSCKERAETFWVSERTQICAAVFVHACKSSKASVNQAVLCF